MFLVEFLGLLGLIAFGSPAPVRAQTKVLLSNDDGWATANIRAQYEALNAQGYNVVLSAPALNQSGTSSLDFPPSTVPSSGCEFDSCPGGSPPTGHEPDDPRINYVNSFPATSVRLGITDIGPQFFDGGMPDIVVAGPNVGANTGFLRIEFSGTIGAATEAAIGFGIPAIAMSGAFSTQTSFTILNSSSSSAAATNARVYASLSSTLLSALLSSSSSSSSSPDILPPGTLLNINYPDVTLPLSTVGSGGETDCTSPSSFHFVLTRAVSAIPLVTPPDVATCGTTRLPTESSLLARTDACFASVTVLDGMTKLDADADAQQAVLMRLGGLLSCS